MVPRVAHYILFLYICKIMLILKQYLKQGRRKEKLVAAVMRIMIPNYQTFIDFHNVVSVNICQ